MAQELEISVGSVHKIIRNRLGIRKLSAHCVLHRLKSDYCKLNVWKKGNRKVQGVPQSQAAALPRHQEEEETDKTKQALIEQTY